jgi:hypothetical protein
MGFIHLQIEWNPCLGGCRPQIPVLSACPMSSTEFVDTPPPPPKKFLCTPLVINVNWKGWRRSRHTVILGVIAAFAPRGWEKPRDTVNQGSFATGFHANHLIWQWRTQEFFSEGGFTPGIFFLAGGGGMSTNSVEDRGQREWGSGGGSPLVRGSTQFSNEWNPYSD